jgi:uncharacterized membrane protein YfcA
MTFPDIAFLLVAGVVAGVIGTAGGITSLVSYPALLAVGVPAYQANIANLVAGVACWPASALVSRPELRAVRAHLPAGMAAAAAGAAAGSGLLLITGSELFRRLVPFLVAVGSCVLLAAPRLTSWNVRSARDYAPAATLAVGLISVYGGYFGAGSGVMLLAATMVLRSPRIAEANASKNMYLGAGGVASALILTAAAPVPWTFLAVLAVGLLVGSLFGPILARRLPETLLRWAVAILGFTLAVILFVGSFG